jgi:hypothetical protein
VRCNVFCNDFIGVYVGPEARKSLRSTLDRDIRSPSIQLECLHQLLLSGSRFCCFIRGIKDLLHAQSWVGAHIFPLDGLNSNPHIAALTGQTGALRISRNFGDCHLIIYKRETVTGNSVLRLNESGSFENHVYDSECVTVPELIE